jgi:fatty-acyl-CoA synthase
MENPVKDLLIPRTPSAHDAALLIGRILEHGVANSTAQEIVYGDRLRYTYATLAERVSRLASALAALGVKPGTRAAYPIRASAHRRCPNEGCPA